MVGDKAWLRVGCDAIRHRGPDDDGEWWSHDGRVGLGFRRLAIIDLTPLGHQPMDDGHDLHIVFNGEIYNYVDLRSELVGKGHVFRSHSDTEVILAAYREWGAESLSRLNGMFAMAIHDAGKQQLFLARDRAGEKPLFYAETNGALRFGSELKSLLDAPAFPRRVDREALDCYLAMGFVPGDRCMLAGVQKLPPAHALLFDLQTGRSRVWRYWALPQFTDAIAGVVDEESLLDELENLLEDAVRRQLVADVPVGILLSGGVDSSLITAMAVRAGQKVKTFTVRFPGHARYDETEHARLIARHFGTEQVELEAAEATTELLPILARQFDEPIIDSSMIPTHLVSQLVREHCTVAVGGDGGDELFAGYGHYNRLLGLQQRVGRVPYRVRQGIGTVAGAILPIGFKGRNWLQAQGVDLNIGVPLIASYFDARTRQRLMARHDRWPLAAERIRDERIPVSADLLQRATRMDFENYLAEDILVKVDRASMLNSLEVRAPLLDYRVIEFAFGKVPSRLKATPTNRKILLKRLASRVLPPEFDLQRKQGFSIPLASWLEAGPWQALFRDVLLSSDNTTFDRSVVNALFAGQSRGRANGERLFGLVLFELWRREYHITV
jgi:asparagine synthase (glutamine-hydrolysing)